LLNSTIRN